MVFSSLIFLFMYLPIVLLTYYIFPRKFRNLLLFDEPAHGGAIRMCGRGVLKKLYNNVSAIWHSFPFPLFLIVTIPYIRGLHRWS